MPLATVDASRPAAAPAVLNSNVVSFLMRAGQAVEQAKKTLEPSQYVGMVRPSMRLGAGACVTLASSVACAVAVAAPLARIAAENGGAMQLYKSIPWVGDFATELLGRGGALGAVCTAAPLLGLAMTFLQSQGSTSDRLHWFFTHVAMGMAVSPMWLLPVATAAGALPALVLSGACMVGVAALLGERLDRKQASVQMLLVGMTLVFAGAPIPALLATGSGAGAALCSAAVVMSAGAAVLAGYTVFSNFAALTDDSTAELRACEVKSDLSKWRLNLPDEPNPTAICGSQALLNYAQFIKNQLDRKQRLHVRGILMSGIPGAGKTAVSRSLGNAFAAKTYLISPAKVKAEANPAQYMRNLFAQAKTLGGRAVFIFDDAEVLFADRKSKQKFSDGFDDRTLMTTTLNDCLDGVERDAYEMLLVVISTNNKNYLDDSIKSRFARCSVEFLPPDGNAFVEQFKVIYQRMQEQQNQNASWFLRLSAKHLKARSTLPEAVLHEALKAIKEARGDAHQPAHVVGRDIEVLCDKMLEDLEIVQGVPARRAPTAAELLTAFGRQWASVVADVRNRQYGRGQSRG